MFHWMSCRTRVSVASLWARSNLIGQLSRRRQTEAHMSCENQNQLTRSLLLSRRKLQLFTTVIQVVSRPSFNHAAPTFVSAEILSKFSELQLTGQFTARQTSLALSRRWSPPRLVAGVHCLLISPALSLHRQRPRSPSHLAVESSGR